MKHETTPSWYQSLSPARVCQMLKEDTAKREALGIPSRLGNFHHYCFTREVSINTDQKWLVAIFKKEETSMHTAQDPPKQHQNIIQIWTGPLHNRLVVTKEPWKWQRWWHTWHEDKHWCSVHNNEHSRIYVNTRYMANNTLEWSLTAVKRPNHVRLATKQKQNSTEAETILQFKDNLGVMDSILLKGKCIIIPKELKKQA